ncbi:hypothetical protein EDC56_2966 [Sinobacterium caligoides]|uniref:DUF416 family protein n=1 Tax=Sinobacterium caligoides TaxID=933926 RepID=A0A3N2DKJ9_9GAMM|nr:YjaG family protein [Sinobacterium caligoides]ROS00320.1 hypothetical protein EDC56_2966 [Sinobacterium caligoides]
MNKKPAPRASKSRITSELRRTVLLAAAVCQRSYPNYQLFCQVSEFTDAVALRNILNVVWEWLLVDGAKINFELQAEKLEVITPDADDFDMFGVYPAIDACVVLNSALNCVLEGEGESYRREVLAVSRGAIEGFLEMQQIAPEDSELIEANEYLLDTILQLPDAELKSATVIRELRKLAINDGVSNLGISAE